MSPNIPLKSSFRQPLRSLFLVLLFGMASFAFVSNAVQYLVVQRETGRLGSYYRSIGSLEPLNGDEAKDISAGASLIHNSPYLAYEDRRSLTSGVTSGVWNPNVWLPGVDDNGMWFYGTLLDRRAIVTKNDPKTSLGYALIFEVDQVLAGFPDDIQAGSGKAINLVFLFAGHGDAISKIEAMQIGQRYLVRGWKDSSFQTDPDWQTSTSNFQIKALDDAGLWYLPVAAGGEVDFTAPGMAGIKNDIDILNQNQHAFLLFGTTDMSAMPQMQTVSHIYYLTSGRWLNHQDDLAGNQVIVIQRDFAASQKLKVGDSITMTLRGLKDPFAPYIQGKDDRENWRSYPTHQETFKIVGVYSDWLGLSTTNNAYVPDSTLPADAVYPENILYADSYSFVLDSSQHQEAFVDQYKDALAQLGFSLNFVENNGVAFWASVTPMRRSALAGLVIYSLVLLAALVLAAFLYLNQRRKDYAILCALGMPKARANRQIILPIYLMGAVGVLVGGIPAWGYALGKSAQTLSQLPTPAGLAPTATLNPLILSALGSGLLLLLAGIAWAGTRILAGRPVLDLLGREAPARKERRPTLVVESQIAAKSAAPVGVGMRQVSAPFEPRLQQAVKNKSFIATGALAYFGLHSIERPTMKSLLTVLVALGLVVALGWMQWSMDRNRAEVDHLYATIAVEAEIIPVDPSIAASVTALHGEGFIAQAAIDKLLASGFIQSSYTEALDYVTAAATVDAPAKLLDVVYPLRAIDQPEKYFATMTTRDTVQYAPGWDESLFTRDWTEDELEQQGVPALFPDSFLKDYHLKLGDKIYFYEESRTDYCYIVAGQYAPGDRQISVNIIESDAAYILLPLPALKVIQKSSVYYTTAQFVIDPAKNRELPVFEQEMSTMISGSGAGKMPLKIHFWDEELRAVVAPMEKNLSLLQVLYPVTLAVSVLIGAGLCLLLALQQAKDAALLRMLGATRFQVRLLLGSEQLLLSLVGVLVGLGLLGILRQDVEAVFSGSLLLSAGLYLLGALVGSLIGAILVSNKKPLELLQVKE